MYEDLRSSMLSSEEANLADLHKWLTYELATAPVGILAFAAPGFLITIVLYAAILFSPYLIWRLAQVKRYGWIAAFLLLVGLPFAIRFIFKPEMVGDFLLTWLPLINFYLFTFVLRHSVSGWLEELKWKRQNRRMAARSREW